MDLTSPELVPAAHVLNTMSQQQQINIPGSPSQKSVLSDPVSTDDLNTLSQEHEINIPDTPGISEIDPTDDLDNLGYDIISDGASATAQLLPHRRPYRDLLDGSPKGYMDICVPLHEAAITGDWEAARVIFDKYPELVRYAITYEGDTPLHVALSVEATEAAENFVENIVRRMEITDLEIQNDAGDYAYHALAVKGSVKMLEILLNKHKTLLIISPDKAWNALVASTQYGNKKMASYLYTATAENTTDAQKRLFIVKCIAGDMFDIALKVLEGPPEISLSIDTYLALLDKLAQSPDALNRTDRGIIWRITNPFFAFFHLKKGSRDMDYQALDLLKYILQSYPKSSQPNATVEVVPFPNDEEDSQEVKSTPYEIILAAAKKGNTRFVIEFLAIFPNLVSAVNKDGLSIFHIAVVHRHIGIYNLLYEIGAKKDIIIATCTDEMKNNILHLVGMTSNNSHLLTMSRASLLMQRELLWFKEVEKMTPSWMRNSKNENGLTPYELFSETNKHLVSKGLKWTKDCMVVATLIITITFAAAFTVPGGYNQPTGAPILSPGGNNQQIGIPIFALEPSFLIFIIADAVSLFSSSTSLLVFLSIVTSPYGQRDFLYSLPRKLMIGLLTLFISVAAMMVTFAASFFVLYRNTTESLPILISIFAATPVVVFAALQYPLLMDMFRSMYDSRYLFKPKRRMLYNRGQKF